MDWWVNNPIFCSKAPQEELGPSLARIEQRLAQLESASVKEAVPA